MQNKRKVHPAKAVFTALLVINLCVSTLLAAHLWQSDRVQGYMSGSKYTLYLGVDPSMTPEEGAALTDAVIARYTAGYTRLFASNGRTDENGVLVKDNALVYILYDIDEETLSDILEETRTALMQDSVMVEKETSRYAFYEGPAE